MTIINAREARELVESSTKMLDQRLETISRAIREQATLGSKELMLHSYIFGNATWMEVEEQPFRTPEFTPVQKLVKKELERQGFKVDIHTYDITIGGGFGDPDPGRPGTAHVIRIRW